MNSLATLAMIWHLCGVPAECYNILTLTVYTILYISMSASVILFQRPVHGLWVCNAFFFFEMMVSSFSLSFLKSHPLRETILVTFICDFPSCLYNNIPSPLSHIHTLKKNNTKFLNCLIYCLALSRRVCTSSSNFCPHGLSL